MISLWDQYEWNWSEAFGLQIVIRIFVQIHCVFEERRYLNESNPVFIFHWSKSAINFKTIRYRELEFDHFFARHSFWWSHETNDCIPCSLSPPLHWWDAICIQHTPSLKSLTTASDQSFRIKTRFCFNFFIISWFQTKISVIFDNDL